MREPRNPFQMRTSEHIEADLTFLKLFDSEVLEVFKKEGIWNKVQIIQSAPGGGKTSLLRIFTPQSLTKLYERRSNEEYKELYLRLKDLGVLSENGPEVLGIYLSCARNYASLEDSSFDQLKKERIFYALLNSRIVLATLKSALDINQLKYPYDLDKIVIKRPSSCDTAVQLPDSESGKSYYDWACEIERKVCESIDSYESSPDNFIEGHDTLHSLSLLRPELIECDGKPIVHHVLFLLDDVHSLTASQRKRLIDTLITQRHPIGIWIAERLEALAPRVLLGATEGREFNEGIILEDYWREHSKRYIKVVTNIADKRARLFRDVQFDSFVGNLQESIDNSEWTPIYNKAINEISTNIQKKVGRTVKYEQWISDVKKAEGTPRERAVSWAKLQIRIERDRGKSQSSLDLGIPLPPDEMEKKDSYLLGAAAEFFLSRDYGIPYCYGMSGLASLSSSNIEQFLDLSADLFEQMISAAIMRRDRSISPKKQETIFNAFSQKKWDEIPKRIPYGIEVQNLLSGIGKFAKAETDRPNAPYAPGVTGIAISMADRDRIINSRSYKLHPEYEELVGVLSACISNNLLEARLDMKQGSQTWLILNLNRWLCLHFKLPLNYGGWRPKKPEELCSWLGSSSRNLEKTKVGKL